ncbi:MAG: hypothetical protein JWN98_72 [Abditibacteriota bacterium]|nr:hypothetical protein [Abditibacteriota bacterium]
MALNLRPNASQHNTPNADPSRYERICSRCGLVNPFVNRICAECGARMANTLPVIAPTGANSKGATSRSPSRLADAPNYTPEDSASFTATAPNTTANTASAAADDEARWTTYWQRVSGQAAAPPPAPLPAPSRLSSTPGVTLPPSAFGACSGHDSAPFDYADLAPGAYRRALRRNVMAAAGSWLGLGAMVLLMGLAILRASSWKNRSQQHNTRQLALQRQAKQQRAKQQAIQRRWAWARDRGAQRGRSAATRSRANGSRMASRMGSRQVPMQSARTRPSDIKELLAGRPSWQTRLRWIANYWNGFQSRGDNAGQMRPAYTRAIRDWDRRHSRRHLEVRNN